MVTFAVSMVKDEADVVEGCVRHMASQVDGLIVADNGSTDGTRDILHDLRREVPVTVVDDPEPAYYQSAKMTQLAEAAAAMGATWIVPFDADELWIAASRFRLADALADIDPAFDIVRADLTDHRPTALDADVDDPFLRMQWREPRPAPMGKVAFRWSLGAVIHQGNHGVTLRPGGVMSVDTRLEIRHFQYRSEEQFVRKVRNGAAAYAATDLPDSEGAHWRHYGRILERRGEQGLVDVYRRHHWHLSPLDDGLVHDPAPYKAW